MPTHLHNICCAEREYQSKERCWEAWDLMMSLEKEKISRTSILTFQITSTQHSRSWTPPPIPWSRLVEASCDGSWDSLCPSLKVCSLPTSLTLLSRERDNVVYWKTNRKIINDLQFNLYKLPPPLLSGPRNHLTRLLQHPVHTLRWSSTSTTARADTARPKYLHFLLVCQVFASPPPFSSTALMYKCLARECVCVGECGLFGDFVGEYVGLWFRNELLFQSSIRVFLRP